MGTDLGMQYIMDTAPLEDKTIPDLKRVLITSKYEFSEEYFDEFSVCNVKLMLFYSSDSSNVIEIATAYSYVIISVSSFSYFLKNL